MRRIWITLGVAVGLALTAAIVWWVTSARKVPEPTFAARAVKRLAAKRLARAAPPDCRPLPNGGFSCGACRDDSDCPPEAGCVVNLESGRTECQGSECQSSEVCQKGAFCRVVAKTSRGELLRACVPPGKRTSGAACDAENGAEPSVSCGPGLLCVDGGCAPPCRPNDIDEPSMCPGELPCVATANGWGCTPTCKQQPCDQGKTCSFLSVEGPISLCTYAVGKNCLGSKGGCPQNTDCVVETNARAERTTFSCVPRCTPGSGDETCPAASVCVPGEPNGHCRRRCTPGADVVCADGERCTQAPGTEAVWYCSAV